ILAALRERESTGQGQVLQSALFENAAYLVSTAMMQQAITGVAPEPMPAGRRAWGVYDVFTGSDGVQIFVGVVTDRQWEIFCQALGEPVLLGPEYATNNLRSAARETLIPLVQSLLGRLTAAEIEALCEPAGLPFARINKPWDLFEDPHLKASGGLLPVTLPDGRVVTVPALPMQFGEKRLGVRHDLAAPGQHNEEILGPLRGEEGK
ncbi:MAG: CoA transferase, partial [Roseococcus sp.]